MAEVRRRRLHCTTDTIAVARGRVLPLHCAHVIQSPLHRLCLHCRRAVSRLPAWMQPGGVHHPYRFHRLFTTEGEAEGGGGAGSGDGGDGGTSRSPVAAPRDSSALPTRPEGGRAAQAMRLSCFGR